MYHAIARRSIAVARLPRLPAVCARVQDRMALVQRIAVLKTRLGFVQGMQAGPTAREQEHEKNAGHSGVLSRKKALQRDFLYASKRLH